MAQKKIDEIILKLLGHDDSVAIGNGYHDDCQLEAEETKKAIADLFLGLPSLQAEMDSLGKGREAMLIEAIRNGMRDTIRHEIAEALGVNQ